MVGRVLDFLRARSGAVPVGPVATVPAVTLAEAVVSYEPPSQKPFITSAHDAPPATRSTGVKMPSRYTAPCAALPRRTPPRSGGSRLGPDGGRRGQPHVDEMLEVTEAQPVAQRRLVGDPRSTPLRRAISSNAGGRTVPSRRTWSSILGNGAATGTQAESAAPAPVPGSKRVGAGRPDL